MQIRQLQVANDSVQDRLVLRIGTGANEEIRVFFTRRFLRELWPVLTAMLTGHLQGRPLVAPEQAATPGATPSSFEQPFHDDNPTYPLGSQPLLASEATLEAAGDGLARLTVREGRERSFHFNVNGELLQALCAMLRAASAQAAWDLALDYDAPAPHRASPAPGPGPGQSRLH